MRYIFGIGGILITILVIVIMLSAEGGPGDYMATTLKKGHEAQGDARQLAGIGDNGMKTRDSIVLDPLPGSGRTRALVVTSIVTGGPMQTHFGLMANDRIVEVGPLKVRDIDDPEMAKALTLDAFQRQQTLIIERGGQKLALPGGFPVDGPLTAPQTSTDTTADTTAAPAPTPTPAAEAPAAPPAKRTSIYDQVNKIPGVQR
jgi:hypothetical protein